MSRLSRYWHTLVAFLGILTYIARHYRSRLRFLCEHSRQALAPAPLPDKIKRRYQKYVPVFLGIEYMYGLLMGQPLDEAQRRRATLLCGITPTFDDMIDDYDYTTAQIMPLVEGKAQPVEPEARCAVAFYQSGQFEWNAYWDHTLAVQTESIHQKAKGLSQPELLELTREKGGISVVYGWHVITEEQGGAPVAKAAYELGAYAQLVNDIFDLYPDREAGITTLVTQCDQVQDLLHWHHDFYRTLVGALREVPVPRSNIRQLEALMVLLYALSEVALEQLLALQQNNGGRFGVQLFSRTQLVCDMSRWHNRLKWGWKVLKMA